MAARAVLPSGGIASHVPLPGGAVSSWSPAQDAVCGSHFESESFEKHHYQQSVAQRVGTRRCSDVAVLAEVPTVCQRGCSMRYVVIVRGSFPMPIISSIK